MRSVEGILAEAGAKGTLESAKEACEVLKDVMEEGLAHCHRLQTQYFITKLLLSARDSLKFQELSETMHKQLGVVATAASVSVGTIVLAEFKQGQELASKVEQLGGPDAIAVDPEKRKACRAFMKDSDAVIAASVEAVGDSVKSEGEKSRKHLESRIEMLSEENRMQQKVLSEQVEKLTSMMQAVMKFRSGADKAVVPDGDIDGTKGETPGGAPAASDEPPVEVNESAMSADGVRDIVSRMPSTWRPDEADRRMAVKKLGLEATEVTDLIGNEELRALTDAVVDELGVTDSYIGTIEGSRQTYLSMTSKVNGELLPRADGMWWANDVGACRYVIGKGDAVVANGSIGKNTMDNLPNWELGEMQAMAEAGNEEVGNLLGTIMQVMGDPDGKIPDDQLIDQAWNPNGVKGMTFGGMRSFLGMTVQSEESHYTGVPIKVGGQIVATLCAVDRTRNRDDVPVERMKELAERARKVIERRIEERAARGEGPSLTDYAALTAEANKAQLAKIDATECRRTALEQAAQGKVVDLTGETFADVTTNPDADVAVMLVTPWCAHCGDVKLAWAEAARRQVAALQSEAPRPVIFATFDVQHEDPPTPMRAHATTWVAKEVPALVLAPAGVDQPPQKFGPCPAQDLPRALQWLRDKGVRVAEAPALPDPRPPPLPAIVPTDTSAVPAALTYSAAIAPTPSPSHKTLAALSEDEVRLRRASETALDGLRRAMLSTSEVIAAWGGAVDALAAAGEAQNDFAAAAATFPQYLERSLAVQSSTARDYVALSAAPVVHLGGSPGSLSAAAKPPPPGWEEAVKAQQEVNANQARLLRTVAMAQSRGNAGAGGLRAQVGELMRVSEGATSRHLEDAMEALRTVRGVKPMGALGMSDSAA